MNSRSKSVIVSNSPTFREGRLRSVSKSVILRVLLLGTGILQG